MRRLLQIATIQTLIWDPFIIHYVPFFFEMEKTILTTQRCIMADSGNPLQKNSCLAQLYTDRTNGRELMKFFFFFHPKNFLFCKFSQQ